MNAENVTPDESAPEPLVVPGESPTAMEPVDAPATEAAMDAAPADVPVEPVDHTAVDPSVDHAAHHAVEPAAHTPVEPAAHTAVESTAEPVVVPEAEPVAQTVVAEPVAGEPVVAPGVQTIYVTAPHPPKPKGNRGMGTLLAVVGTIAFAVVYAAVAAALILFISPSYFGGAIGQFVTGPQFYVPVLVFLVVMVLWALLANRASWWSWVIGSLVIAVVTYFASIGILLLMSGGFGLTGSKAALIFVGLAINPALIAAAIVARESAIWFGAAIAKRGRKVRERNYEAWQQFEREETQKRAEFGGATAA